jgi:hypothetical protein
VSSDGERGPFTDFAISIVLILLIDLLTVPGLQVTPLAEILWPVTWALMLPTILIGARAAEKVFGSNFHCGWHIAAYTHLRRVTWMMWVTLLPGLLLPSVAVALWLRPTGILEERGRIPFALAATTVVSLPFLLLSAWLDARIAQRFFAAEQKPKVRRWAAIVNLWVLVPFVALCAYGMDRGVADWQRRRERPRLQWCLSNVKQVGTALQMYAQDWNDRFPPAANFPEAARPYLKRPQQSLLGSGLACPSSLRTYLFNHALSGAETRAIEDPQRTPAIRDAVPHRLGRRERRVVMGFADGHARTVAATDPAATGGDFR